MEEKNKLCYVYFKSFSLIKHVIGFFFIGFFFSKRMIVYASIRYEFRFGVVIYCGVVICCRAWQTSIAIIRN